MSSEFIHNLNSSNFSSFIKEHPVVLVDFWAPWCGPCKALGVHLEKVAPLLQGKCVISKLNIEEDGNETLAAEFQIRGIPALIVFKNGEIADKKYGYLEEAKLQSWLESF